MKIVINAVSAKMGGAVTYLTNILRCLPPPESSFEFDVFTPPETAETQKGLPRNVRLVASSIGQAAWWKRFWWEQVTLRRWLKRRKAHVLFATANFGMFHCPVRQILLVRNALYFSKIYQDEFLARHSLRFRVPFKFRRWLICRSVRQADVVMTPTQAMLDDLRRFVEVESWKSLVNPYGANPLGCFPPEAEGQAPQSPAGTAPVMRLIYVSLYSEHKNLATLLKAMSMLNRNGAGTFLLRTTVDPGWEEAKCTVTYKEDLALAHQPDVAPWVEFLGPLAQQQVEELYREGDIFVFPSLCESFGHPMVEAMAHGLPIVVSNTPVNREICGEAGVYFNPHDPEDLAEKVRSLWGKPTAKEHLSEAGRRRVAQHFRWESHVARFLEAAQGRSLANERTLQELETVVLPMPQENVASGKPDQCPLCGCEQNSPWPRWDLLRCDECGLVFDRRVWRKGAELDSEREWFEEGYVGLPSPWVRIFENLNNQRTYRRIAPFLRNGARLLEVGVGSGSFLEYAKGKGVNVTGCDLSTAVCEDVAGRLHIPMLNCSVGDLPNDTKYDVLVMNHVLEHVGLPAALLEDVRCRTKEDGLVHIATPNVACWEAGFWGWASYEPYHFIYFSPHTIRKTVEKSGFTVLKVLTHEPFSAWFLTALRTLLGTRMRRAERRYAARRSRSTSWVEHAYRICMVFAGVLSFPLRRLQASLGFGDELVVLCRRAGAGPSANRTNGREPVAIPKPVIATLKAR